MRAVLVTFDRLPLRLLGCYGSQRVATPHFDRLAAESVVFDQHFCEHTGPRPAPHAWWTGCHHFPRLEAGWTGPHLVDELRAAGISVHFLCTPEERDAVSLSFPFASMVLPTLGRGIETASSAGATAEELTSFDRVIRRAEELIRAGGSAPSLVWLHSPGVSHPSGDGSNTAGPERDAGDGEPGPIERCGAEVAQLDDSLGRLLQVLGDAAGDAPPLLIVTAAAGLPLGEGALFAADGSVLREEIVHTPLVVRVPGSEGGRRQDLVGTIDVAPTLREWFGLPDEAFPCEGQSLLPTVRGLDAPVRPYLCLGDGTARGIRTPEFFLARTEAPAPPLPGGQPAPGAAEPAPPRLFIKPDDLWDIHDVAPQFPGQVERLAAVLERFVANARAKVPLEWPPLADGSASE